MLFDSGGLGKANVSLVSSGHSLELFSGNRGHAGEECVVGSDEFLVVGAHF